MKIPNLYIVGTSHIAKQSLEEVKETIETVKPQIIALELDKPRLEGLLSKQKSRLRLRDIARIGVKGYLFSLFGSWAEKKLGEKVGISPGSEMLTAYKIAQKEKINVALIDQDIEITLKRFSKLLSIKEIFNGVVDVVKGFFQKQKTIEFDLNKVPEQHQISKLIEQVKDRYPNIYKVLIVERNEVMARNLAKLLSQHPDDKIVAIMGAGHEEEITKLVQKYLNRFDSIRR